MDSFNPQQVMSGTQGELWINGIYMAEVTEFKAEMKLIKEEVNMVKTMSKKYKTTGWEGSGSMKLNHVTSFFVDLIMDDIKAGRQTVATLMAVVNDPDGVGQERVIIRDATFDKLTLMNWSAKKLIEDDYDFTFTDFDYPDRATA